MTGPLAPAAAFAVRLGILSRLHLLGFSASCQSLPVSLKLLCRTAVLSLHTVSLSAHMQSCVLVSARPTPPHPTPVCVWCSWVWAHVCMDVPVVTLLFIYWCRASHRNPDLASLASQLSLGDPRLYLRRARISGWHLCGDWRSKSGPHAYITNTSPPEPTPQLWILILIYTTMVYTRIIHSSAASSHFGSLQNRNLGSVTPILHGARWVPTRAMVVNVIWDSCH